MDFRELVRRTSRAITDDGVVTLGETAMLLRMVRPFAEQGDASAIELANLLRNVREDGVISPEESQVLCDRLNAFAARPDVH